MLNDVFILELSQVRSVRTINKLLRATLICAVMLLGACSTTRPWTNQRITPTSPMPVTSITGPAVLASAPSQPPSIVAAVTLSGGGARAAAFGLGVLQELKATEFELQGRPTSLLDEVGLISGVSGGSVLATYYAAFGDEVFTQFENDFLFVNFQSGLVADVVSPVGLYRLSSPWYGRSNALAKHLDTVFRGTTFGELRARQRRPRLLVTATDLSTGLPFEFTPEQFALICSDLDSVPLSFAVAASSSVPVLLSPVTVRNYAGSCPQTDQMLEAASAEQNLSAHVLRFIAESYRNAEERPYIHLVDGGLVDNLGVRSLLDHTVASNSLDASFRGVPPGSIHKIVLISVNSERVLGDTLDASDHVPSIGQVLDAMVYGAGSRLTKETTAMVNDTTRRLSEELSSTRGKLGSPFASDAEIYVINVSLQDVADTPLRKALLQVPTAFTILPTQVRQLEAAGRRALSESPEYQRLRGSLVTGTYAAAVDVNPLVAPKSH